MDNTEIKELNKEKEGNIWRNRLVKLTEFGCLVGLTTMAVGVGKVYKEEDQKIVLRSIFSKAKTEVVDTQKTAILENIEIEYASKDTLYTVTAADIRAMGLKPPAP